MVKNKFAAVLLFALISSGPLQVQAQSTSPEEQNPPVEQNAQDSTPQQDSGTNGTAAPVGSAGPISGKPNPSNQQPKRILGIIPNFQAVSADTLLPPLSPKGKLWLATQGSFDYSSFLFAGIMSGIGQLRDSQPEFGQGAAGYGRRYWHWMANGAIANYFTEGFMPILTREDPRYYTLGRGNYLHRTGYAVSRLFVAKTDSGNWRFNISEISGNGMAAAIANAYYPQQDRGWVKTYQLWIVSMTVDGASNILKEFWPDISAALFGSRKKADPAANKKP